MNMVLDPLRLIVVVNKDVRLGERNKLVVKGEPKKQRKMIST